MLTMDKARLWFRGWAQQTLAILVDWCGETITETVSLPTGGTLVITYLPPGEAADEPGEEEPDDMPVTAPRRRGPKPGGAGQSIRDYLATHPDAYYSDILDATESAGHERRTAANHLRALVTSGEVLHPSVRGPYRLADDDG